MDFRITFHPAGRTVRVARGETLLQAALHAGLLIPAPCGAGGTCGKCRVKILSGQVAGARSAHRLSPEEMAEGWRLACCTRPDSDADVLIPPLTDREAHATLRILTEGQNPEPLPLTGGATGTLGVAIDLGTTTIAASLVELDTGLVCDTLATINQQINYGDDVIARIALIRQDPARLHTLRQAAIDSINTLIDRLCTACGISPALIRRVTLAGNTAMQEILLGIDPVGLAQIPFAPAFLEAETRTGADLTLHTAPEAEIYCFPQIGGFLGGDALSGILAAGFDKLTAPTLLIDIGTNGEVLLLTPDRLLACSTAAGPAFEGARIRQGMRATNGAIDHVYTEGNRLITSTIGNAPPTGICGTALIDAISELLTLGIIDSTGRILPFDELPPTLAPEIRVNVVLAHQEESALEETAFRLAPRVHLYQRDIREYQLAAAAIRAAIHILLTEAHLEPRDLDRILLAGAFGTYIRRDSAIRTGLLPPLPPDRIAFIGNASLTGARLALLSHHARRRAEALRRRTRHIELSRHPAFTDLYAQFMLFPENEPKCSHRLKS